MTTSRSIRLTAPPPGWAKHPPGHSCFRNMACRFSSAISGWSRASRLKVDFSRRGAATGATIAAGADTMSRELDDRHEALGRCLEKLHPRDRELLLVRYERGGGVEEADRRTGRTVTTAYKALTRLRKLLLDCVTTRLAAEGGAA